MQYFFSGHSLDAEHSKEELQYVDYMTCLHRLGTSTSHVCDDNGSVRFWLGVVSELLQAQPADDEI